MHEVDQELWAQYYGLDDRAKDIVITASKDTDQQRRLSLSRLYFPGVPDRELILLLDHLRQM